MTSQKASILIITGAILWGTNPALIKLINWTPIGTAWIRGCFCAALLLVYLIHKRHFSLRSLGLQLFSGLFLALNSALFVGASLYTSPANAVLLLFIFPWMTLGLDFFIRGQVPSRADVTRLLMGFSGIVIIVSGELEGSGALGNMLAVFAGVSVALHIFLSQKLEERHGGNQEVLSSVMIAWIATVILLAPFALLDNATVAFQWDSSRLELLFVFGLLSAIPWLLWSQSIAYIPGHVVAALLGVEVFVAALCGWLMLGETPGMVTWVGGILTLMAATSQILAKTSPADAPENSG